MFRSSVTLNKLLHAWYRGSFDKLRDFGMITEVLHSLGELLPWITKLLHLYIVSLNRLLHDSTKVLPLIV